MRMQDTVKSLEGTWVGGHLNWASLFPAPSSSRDEQMLGSVSPTAQTEPRDESLTESWLRDLQQSSNSDMSSTLGWHVVPD